MGQLEKYGHQAGIPGGHDQRQVGKWRRWVALGLAAVSLAAATALRSSDPAEAATGVVKVNYVKGYQVALWADPPLATMTKQKVNPDSTWKTFRAVKAKNQLDYYFLVGNNKWLSSRYADQRQETSVQQINATGRVNYVPGYGIVIWGTPLNGKPVNIGRGRRLAHGTTWRVYQRAVVNGKVWYELGSEQWVDGQYLDLISERSRDRKAYLANEPTIAPASNPQPDLDSTRIVPAQVADQIVYLLNQYRQSQGKAILTRDSALMAGALERAQDEAQAINDHGGDIMVADHTNANGTSFDLSPGLIGTQVGGENLAVRSGGTDNSAQVASKLMTQWKNSPGHNENMLDSSFSRIGVGVVRTKNGYYVAVQDFGW